MHAKLWAAVGLGALLLVGRSGWAEEELAGTSTDAVAEATAQDGLYAVLRTNHGTIVTRLHYELVPMTVGNFVSLAEGTREFRDPKTARRATRPFYDGLIFHRIVPGFMIQGGCPLGTGASDPGYHFPDEFERRLRHDGPGVLSMANSGPNSNGSQFFITLAATDWLDDRHTVFGRVVHGMDVVQAIAAVPTTDSRPQEDVVIERILIVRSGADAEAFDAEAAFAMRKLRPEERLNLDQENFVARVAELRPQAQADDTGMSTVLLQEGEGEVPREGEFISVHYTGYLDNGTVFDSSRDRGKAVRMRARREGVNPRWDLAFLKMREGERRMLFLPPELGFGEAGIPGVVPSNAELIFDVELLEILD